MPMGTGHSSGCSKRASGQHGDADGGGDLAAGLVDDVLGRILSKTLAWRAGIVQRQLTVTLAGTSQRGKRSHLPSFASLSSDITSGWRTVSSS